MMRRALPWMLGLVAATSAWAADPQRGGDLYAHHCAGCHGARGRPELAGAPDFTRPGALMKSDLAIAATLRQGRGAMPAYGGLLRERDLLDLVAHLRTLR